MRDFSKVCCSYYGRVFLEAYRAAGGKVDIFDYAIDPRLEQLIKDAAIVVANPPLSIECSCKYYAGDYHFVGMKLAFDCPVHGDVVLDRKTSGFRLTDTITVPSIPQPYQPYTQVPVPAPYAPFMHPTGCTCPLCSTNTTTVTGASLPYVHSYNKGTWEGR